MTQTLQQALLKAGLISQDKLKKAEADKKAAQRAAQHPAPRVPGRPAQGPSGGRPPTSTAPRSSQAPRPNAPHAAAPAPKPAVSAPRPKMEPPPRPARPAPTEQKPGFIEGKHHHHIRTDCEACGRSSPDVEYYEHRNRALDKYWLCVRCADNNNILDEFRQTMQSSQAQKGIFQRGYGPTKVFKKKL
ncbi:MAG TPA: hypothetical protein VFX30_11660 [bacterium]|nr:hypothetical protein [bacterium]